jgi:hypothetical protein
MFGTPGGTLTFGALFGIAAECLTIKPVGKPDP